MTDRLTELVFILDKSGSMCGREEDTIGGFNATIREQKEKGNRVYVTSVLFSDEHSILIDRIPIEEVREMERNDFRVGGCTALIDTIGDTIDHITKVQRYTKSDPADKTIFVIITDGLENASHKYSSKEVKKMIEGKKENGWEFLFLGANIDAVETAKRYGIDEDRAVNYHNDEVGIRTAYKAVSGFVAASVDSGDEKIPSFWRTEADKDYNSRKNKH